jgi:uncharacterized protein (TIGR00645 family)
MSSFVERVILASRWLLVVFYIGLGVALALYAVSFGSKLWEFATHVCSTSTRRNRSSRCSA